jgi:hypothetical protein
MSDGLYKSNEAMFDSNIVAGIHDRKESRIRDLQTQVSVKFNGLKRFAHDLWRVQKIEDLIFGRVRLPYVLINNYLQYIQLPEEIESLNFDGEEVGYYFIRLKHKKYGKILIKFKLQEILLNKDDLKVRVNLENWEMPGASWFTRNMIKVGLLLSNKEVDILNRYCSILNFEKDENNSKQYIINFTNVIKEALDENYLSMTMVRLINWTPLDNNLMLQISISSEKLMKYLKNKMPILFD